MEVGGEIHVTHSLCKYIMRGLSYVFMQRECYRRVLNISPINVQSFNKRFPAEIFKSTKCVRVPTTTKDMVLLIARNEKSYVCGFDGILWHREALNGSLAPQTFRIPRLIPECRCSKSLRNPANLPKTQRPWGSQLISPSGLLASTQTWPWKSVLKVRSVQRNPSTDGIDLTTTIGADDGSGSRIVLRDSQRLDPSGTSTSTPGREDGITCGCILLQLMGPMFTILTALREQEVPSSAPNEQLSHDAPDLHAETQLEVGNQGEREDHGTVAERPSEAPKRTSSDNHVGEDTSDTVKSGRSRGECLCCGTTLAQIDLC